MNYYFLVVNSYQVQQCLQNSLVSSLSTSELDFPLHFSYSPCKVICVWYFGLTLALRSWSCFGFSLFCFQYQRCLQNQNSVKLVGGTLLRCPNKPFMNIWFNMKERYKVLDLERPMHGDNLLACVIDFNSCNMWNVKWKIKSTCTDNSWSKY